MANESRPCFSYEIAMLVATLLFAVSAARAGDAAPPLEAYGALPDVSLVTISPSGKTLAYRRTTAEQDVVAIIDLDKRALITGIDVATIDPRAIRFANDEKILLVAGKTTRSFRAREQREFSAAFLFDLEKKESRQLLRSARDLYPEQFALGRIIDQSDDGSKIFIPAWVRPRRSGYLTYGLYEISTDSRGTRLVDRGSRYTVDWFLGPDGEPRVREDFNSIDGVHQLRTIDGNKADVLYEYETALPTMGISGWSPDRTALVFSSTPEGLEREAYSTISIEDGSIGAPVFTRDDADVEYVLTDSRRVVHGAAYSGFKPSYEFFDPALGERFARIRARFADTSVTLWDWSDDFSRLIVRVSGGSNSGAYFLVRSDETAPELLAYEREAIPPGQVARTIIDKYPARDGLEIPALVTVRPDVRVAGRAPLVVLPHGGPEAYDRFEFDWLAQFLASRGYAVLQPQFRGSWGFGAGLRDAGFGEWGRKMQTDLDDGVAWLVEQGLADPDRVCIAGGSYGGYAALAAGAFSPDIYKCVIAFNGLSDVYRMLVDERRNYGRSHWVVAYWERSFGSDPDRALLKSVSPIEHAEAFEAPVLLLHGSSDTVVPQAQSERMRRALERAGKDVTYVELPAEDHWLSEADSHITLLRAIDDFLGQHL